MNTTSAVVLTGIVAAAGQWAQNKPLTIKTAVGGGILILMLAGLNEIDAGLAGKLAVLILVGALLMYGPAIFKKAGVIK